MVNNYYAGHDLEWMEKFMKAFSKKSKKQRLVKSTAFAIACCIHHQYIYKRQKTFKLSHKILSLFGIDYRYLKPYLILFQQAGLLKFKIEKGKSPIITLKLLPPSTSITKKT